MNFKVFATVFFGLLAVNVSTQTPALKDDSIKPIVIEIVDAILQVTQQGLDAANDAIAQIEQDQSGIEEGVVAFFEGIGKDLSNLIIKIADELRDGATPDGKALIDCVDSEKDKFEAAFAQVFNNLATCTYQEVPKVLEELKTILSQLTDLQNDVQAQTDALSACTLTETLCLTAYAGTLVATVQKIPPIVQADIQQIRDLVQTILADVRACNDGLVVDIGLGLQDGFNDVVVCIKN